MRNAAQCGRMHKMGKVLSAGYAELYEAFLDWQRPQTTVQGFTSIRLASYRVIQWLESQDIRPEECTVQDAMEYKAAMASRITKNGMPVKTETCCRGLSAARTVFRYLVLSGQSNSNPFMAVPYPRRPRRISRNVLTEAQMNVLLERLRKFDTIADYKVHVLAELLYATGLRIAEAASLEPKDIDTRNRMVYVREGKGGKSRSAFLTGYAAEVLERYVSKGRERIFRCYRGQRPQGHTLFGVSFGRLKNESNDVLRAVCSELELPVITSHGFRHSLGTHLLRAGCDMRHIQVILGHDDLRSTQIYTRVNKDDVKKSLDAHHPRQWSSTPLNAPGGTP